MLNDSMLVKPSIYNIIFSKNDGVAAYNTATGKLIRSFEPMSTDVEKLLNSEFQILIDSANEITAQKLYEKGFLVDVKCNEIKEMENKEKLAKFDNYMRLTILPTEQCNFRCVYCYEHFNRGKMDYEVQKRVIHSVEEHICKFDGLIVSWFGGEPLEAIEVIENLSLAFIQICKNHNKVYNAGIVTNGYHLTPKVFNMLKKFRITEYQVTLDGIPSIHNKQRLLADGSKTAEKIIKNLIEIKTQIKSGAFRIVLRTNFSKEMIKYIDEFEELLDSNFGDDPRFNYFWQLIGDYGYVKDDAVRDIFGTYQDYYYLISHFTKRFENKFMSFLYGPAGAVCYALKRNSFVISSDGIIKKCTCDLEYDGNHFGEVGKYFDDTKHEKWLKREIGQDSKCYNCIKRPICHNKACYKAKSCLMNLEHMNSVIELMSENKKYFTII